MAIQNIFKQIAYESIHFFTISVTLQLGYVNQNKRIEKLCGTVITTTLKDHLNSESKLKRTSLEFRIEAKTHLSLHEVHVSYSYSASYVIVTMSHNSTSLKHLKHNAIFTIL